MITADQFSSSAGGDFIAANHFIGQHIEALRARLSDASVRAVTDTRFLFAILTDKDGTIFGGKNSEALSLFLRDAVQAGIDVKIMSGDPVSLRALITNPLVEALLDRNADERILCKSQDDFWLVLKEYSGMAFDDQDLFRKVLVLRGIKTVLDPNSAGVTAFLSSWGRLSNEQKAAVFQPWLALKTATLAAIPPEPGPPVP